jgi:hypothetical protein
MEAGWFKLDLYRGLFCLLSIIIFLGLSRWNITDGFEQALMVEPRYPFQGWPVPPPPPKTSETGGFRAITFITHH